LKKHRSAHLRRVNEVETVGNIAYELEELVEILQKSDRSIIVANRGSLAYLNPTNTTGGVVKVEEVAERGVLPH
jgi:hypothetical protein